MRLKPLLLVAMMGCTPRAKLEARSLVSAVERYHKAENSEKPAAADELEKVACTDEEVCAVKALCVKGASAMAKALRKQKEVADVMAAWDGGVSKDDPRMLGLPGELDEIDRLMQESVEPMRECDERLGGLRMKAR